MSATANLSRRNWPAFGEYDLDSGSLRSDAVLDLRRPVPEGAVFADESVSFSQKTLSSLIEARAFSDFMTSDQVEVHRNPHLVLNRNPGAGAWLTSLPDSSDTHCLPLHSKPSALRMAIWDEDSICPLCGRTQDR